MRWIAHGKHHAAFRQVDRTRGGKTRRPQRQQRRTSCSVASHPPISIVWKFFLGLDGVTPYFLDRWKSKRGKYSGWAERARGGETCTPPLGGQFRRILVSAASRVKRLESSHCDIFFPDTSDQNNENSTPSTGTRVTGQLFFRERRVIPNSLQSSATDRTLNRWSTSCGPAKLLTTAKPESETLWTSLNTSGGRDGFLPQSESASSRSRRSCDGLSRTRTAKAAQMKSHVHCCRALARKSDGA